MKSEILRCTSNTLHLPHPHELLDLPSTGLRSALEVIFESTGISEGTIHPDRCSTRDFESLLQVVPDAFCLSVENMDIRKDNFQNLEELSELLSQFPRLMWTFDICHWIENKKPLLAREVFHALEVHGERLTKFHFSVPSSRAGFYRQEDQGDCHFLSAGSGWELEGFFTKVAVQVPWVIEGTIPRGRFESIEQEIQELMHSLAQLDRRVAA